MSIPHNHHHVSQTHIRAFFNNAEKKIYCYDKQLNNFYYKPSTKTLFSEEYANTREVNGQLDHQTLEDLLNDYFENDFDSHARKIKALAIDPSKRDNSTLESFYYLACYALISDVRYPENKKVADTGVDWLMNETAKKVRMLGDEQQASLIEKSMQLMPGVKYSNLIDYRSIAAKRLEKMGDLDFSIISIASSDIFILPDTGCFLHKARINEYFNPHITDIAVIGLPLSDKVFMLAMSKKLEDTASGILTINDDNSSVVHEVNFDLYHAAHKAVATNNQDKLKSVVSAIKARR